MFAGYPKRAQYDPVSFRHALYDSTDMQIRSKAKRKYNPSSDSSLLEFAPRPKSHPLVREEAKSTTSDRPREPSTYHCKRRSIGSSNPGMLSQPSAPSSHHNETFKKRARHMTREDRYEPNKRGRKSGKADEGRRSRIKREKKGNRKKQAKKAGEELMKNFSSKSIGQNRLTVSRTLSSSE